jgi:hypothetical protein
MDKAWQEDFRNRMHGFVVRKGALRPGSGVSIKVRIESGCFHRDHSPEAYRIIDRKLTKLPGNVDWVEHESGPELLVYLAVTTAGLTLAKSVIDLLTTIIKARSEGIKKGDQPCHPLVLIVRRITDKEGYREEIVAKIPHTSKVDAAQLREILNKAISDIYAEDDEQRG